MCKWIGTTNVHFPCVFTHRRIGYNRSMHSSHDGYDEIPNTWFTTKFRIKSNSSITYRSQVLNGDEAYFRFHGDSTQILWRWIRAYTDRYRIITKKWISEYSLIKYSKRKVGTCIYLWRSKHCCTEGNKNGGKHMRCTFRSSQYSCKRAFFTCHCWFISKYREQVHCLHAQDTSKACWIYDKSIWWCKKTCKFFFQVHLCLACFFFLNIYNDFWYIWYYRFKSVSGVR